MKYIREYSDFSLNESITIEGYQKTVSKLIKDLKLNLYMITSFGVAFASFFPIVDGLIKNEGMNFTPEMIVVVSLSALAIMLHENTSEIEKLRNYAIEKGVFKMIAKIVDVLKGIKRIFPKLMDKVFKTTQNVTISLVNIFSYTAMCVPLMRAMFDLIRDYEITADNLAKYLIATGMGIGLLAVNQLIDELFNRVREKIKKLFGTKSESILIDEYNSIFS